MMPVLTSKVSLLAYFPIRFPMISIITTNYPTFLKFDSLLVNTMQYLHSRWGKKNTKSSIQKSLVDDTTVHI